MDCNPDGRRRAVAGDLGDRLGAERSVFIIHIDQHCLEIIRLFPDHRYAVIRHIGIQTDAVLVKNHPLIESMTD